MPFSMRTRSMSWLGPKSYVHVSTSKSPVAWLVMPSDVWVLPVRPVTVPLLTIRAGAALFDQLAATPYRFSKQQGRGEE